MVRDSRSVRDSWQPFCGKEFGRSLSGLDLSTVPMWANLGENMVAGDPVVCDLPPHPVEGPKATKHCNSELSFSWW